jgi:hypothetical protein
MGTPMERNCEPHAYIDMALCQTSSIGQTHTQLKETLKQLPVRSGSLLSTKKDWFQYKKNRMEDPMGVDKSK